MPYVIFVASPGMEELKNIHEFGTNIQSSRNSGVSQITLVACC